MLSLLVLVLFACLNAVSAATTVDQTSILKSAETTKKLVETKKTLPGTLTVAKKKLTKTQYLNVLTTTVTNVNKKSKKSVAVQCAPISTLHPLFNVINFTFIMEELQRCYGFPDPIRTRV